MNRVLRLAPWIAFACAAAFCVAVCHQRLITTAVYASTAAVQDQAPPPPDQGTDPAAGNVAPSGPSYTTQAPPPPDQNGAAPGAGMPPGPGMAPGPGAAPGPGGAPGPDDQDYAEQPTETATEAPPPLPDYEQPEAPGDGYIWTPGYWAWGPDGYYWVPGAWVEPPYMGALWTPGYWGFYGGRYSFYPGYWGNHIGFYGGINYGFGYVGFGYEGGYWRSGHFFYNRVYNNINVRNVHNVYSYRANVHVNTMNRASYRGPSGVDARPQAGERAAWHEPTAPRMQTQVQHAQTYRSQPGQYASHNNGRPATPAVSRPVPADHNVQPSVRSQSHSGGGNEHR